MRKMVLSIVIGSVVAMIGLSAQAGGPHPVAEPFGAGFEFGEPSTRVDRERARIPIDHLVLGTEHILDQQCYNGGFGWEHDDCSATFNNITAPILLGALETYYHTRESTHIVGALAGGAFDMNSQFSNGEARFSTFTPVFMLDLAIAADNPVFSDFASVGLFDELQAGTYGDLDYDTAAWIARIQTVRTGTWVNLRPWEFHLLIDTARLLGHPGQDDLFEQAVLDGLATLDNTDPDNVYSDIIGLAGAVRGLAIAGRISFPPIVAPNHPGVNGIDNLEDLAAYLASLQNPDGSWYWHSNLVMPIIDEEDVQTSAYAVLALLDADTLTAASYAPATEAGRNWLFSMQLPDGGFPVSPGGHENTEIEGEAVTAIGQFDATIFVDGFESGDTVLWAEVSP